MILLIAGITGFVCFIAGLFLGSVFFESMSKVELRKRLKEEKDISLNEFSECRSANRLPVGIYGQITAPILDSAGIASDFDKITCMARIVNVSKNGMGIITDRFLKKGLLVYVSCTSNVLQLKNKEAYVRNITLIPNGILGMRNG